MTHILIKDVFTGTIAPNSTYISQENGRFEKELRQGISEDGNLCLLTGSSKTGKTSLYTKVLESLDRTPIKVRCSHSLTADDFWSYPLEHLDFSRLKSEQVSKTLTTSGSISGTVAIGWDWLAKLSGTITTGLSSTSNETAVKEAFLSKPSPAHLIPLLKNSNAILVVEDFHYLCHEVQREIFQQWKIFTDNQISVIVVGTTHHGVDLAVANPDLVGRIRHIDLGRWKDADLQSIAEKGLSLLKIFQPGIVSEIIAKESAGLPILAQQACAQLFLEKDITERDITKPLTFTKKDAEQALHRVAISRYSHFESWYNQLVNGPRKKARKYDTYQLILALFTQDPRTFSLHRTEIDRRLRASKIPPTEMPPPASITATLSALEGFQKKKNFELLEWSKSDATVYILIPSFLFYLRWREAKPIGVGEQIFELLLKLAGGYLSEAYKANAAAPTILGSLGVDEKKK